MSYKFNPKSDADLDAFDLIEPGVYNFEVIKATHRISKNHNPMAEIVINVWNNSGKIFPIFDYLVFSDIKMNIRKISHFCKAVGLEKEYLAGDIPEDLVGYSGKVEVDIQDEQPKANGGFYPRKNVVIDYVKSEGKQGMKPLPAKNDDFDDKDIPF